MYYLNSHAAVTELNYCYQGAQGTCTESKFPGITYVSKINTVEKHSDSAMRDAMVNGPISIIGEAGSKVFYRYRDGVMNSPDCGTNVNHSMNAVGYGYLGYQKYFIVRNSWGTEWGMDGYINIAAQETAWFWDPPSLGICGIQQISVWPNVNV